MTADRLTDGDLDKLERNFARGGSLMGIPVRRIVAEVRASRALLAELEWNAPHRDVRCPLCLADRLDNERHFPGCRLAAALGRTSEPRP